MRYTINYLTDGQRNQIHLDAENAAEAVARAEQSTDSKRFELLCVRPEPHAVPARRNPTLGVPPVRPSPAPTKTQR